MGLMWISDNKRSYSKQFLRYFLTWNTYPIKTGNLCFPRIAKTIFIYHECYFSLIARCNIPSWLIIIYFLLFMLLLLAQSNNRITRKRFKICSQLTIKAPERHRWRRSGIFIVNFDHILRLFLVFLLLTLNN